MTAAGVLLTVDQLERDASLDDAAWALVALGVAVQLADQMAALHERGVVHGNLGPSTVLLDSMEGGGLRVRVGTAPGRLYPAPELEHDKPATVHSDVYGFGCVLATLLLSVPEPGWEEILRPASRTDVARELRLLAAEAMSEKPASRPFSFRVVQDRLATIYAAWSADRARPGVGAELLDAGRVPDELAAILGWISARVPARLLGWIPGWRRLVEEVGLPTLVRRRRIRGRRALNPGAGAAAVVWPRPHRSRAWLGWVTVAAVAVAIGAGAAWGAAGRPLLPAQAATAAAVPTVAERSVTSATDALTRAGFSVAGQRTRHDAAVPAGKVAGTDPASGSRVGAQGGVVLIVSAGPDVVAVPDLAGGSLGAAEQRLGAAGLDVGAVSHRNGAAPKDTVLSTAPAPGAHAAPGSPVDLVVASGNQTVPAGLVGRASAPVEAALRAIGFQVATRTVDTAEYVTGYVMQAAPAPGQSAPLGSTVTLTVANYVPAPSAPAATPPPSASPPLSPSPSSTPDPTGSSTPPAFIPTSTPIPRRTDAP